LDVAGYCTGIPNGVQKTTKIFQYSFDLSISQIYASAPAIVYTSLSSS